MPDLPNNITWAAIALFEEFAKSGTMAVMIGGGAVILNGFPRTTSDLDFNVSNSSFLYSWENPDTKLEIHTKDSNNQRRGVTTFTLSSGGSEVGCDLKENEMLHVFMEDYQVTNEGIYYLGPGVLLGTKICAFTDIAARQDPNRNKMWKHLQDIDFLVDRLYQQGKKVPSSTRSLLIDDTVISKFLEAAATFEDCNDRDQAEWIEALNNVFEEKVMGHYP